MKKRFTLLVCTCMLSLCACIPASAQMGLLGELLDQMTEPQLQSFISDLNSLNDDFTNDELINDYDLNFGDDALDGLSDFLQTLSDEGFPIDSSYLRALVSGRELFDASDFKKSLSTEDQELLENTFDLVDELFNDEYDNLSDLGEDKPQIDIETDFPSADDYSDEIDSNLDDLNNAFDYEATRSEHKGFGDFKDILNGLFDKKHFKRFEIAYGTQMGVAQYAFSSYRVNTQLLYFGTAPDYTSLLGCRWHVEGSWMMQTINIVDPTQLEINPMPESVPAFQPIMLNGDFAMMLNPTIVKTGPVKVNLLTSLGIEVGTYAPHHRDYHPVLNVNNKGFTTGFGPQLGTGFALTHGNVTTFTQMTASKGHLFCMDNLIRKYQSLKFEAGVRYKNRLVVRYLKGMNNWDTATTIRQIQVDNQISLGWLIGNPR